MPPTLPAEVLLAAAQERQAEIVTFLRDLVRIPSVNGRDPERAVAERIAAEASRLGLDARLLAAQETRPNVLVSCGDGPAGFVLVGHMDTVSEGPAETWTHPPFEAQVEAGRIYGRGTADNKAGIACGLYTLAILRDLGWVDPGSTRLLLAGVVDEESGASSRLGVRYLIDQGALAGARGAIYTYASDIICIGHRGLLRLVLKASGKAIHTGSPAWSRGEGGVNAVTGLAAVLLRLEALDLPAPAHPAFAGLRCRLTPGTVFHGGEFESMVPANAEALVDIRLMPGQPAGEVLRAVEAEIAVGDRPAPGVVGGGRGEEQPSRGCAGPAGAAGPGRRALDGGGHREGVAGGRGRTGQRGLHAHPGRDPDPVRVRSNRRRGPRAG